VVPLSDSFDLASLHLTSGEARRLDLLLTLDELGLSGERYAVTPRPVEVRLDVSRTTGIGYALRLRFQAGLEGPCMRCLEPAALTFDLEAREVWQAGAGEELDSPYVSRQVLDLRAWGRDALALALPPAILCRPDCAGLCPVCGEDLNRAAPDHHHEPTPDPRWAKLSELRFEPE
jgi:uncharacterized protein